MFFMSTLTSISEGLLGGVHCVLSVKEDDVYPIYTPIIVIQAKHDIEKTVLLMITRRSRYIQTILYNNVLTVGLEA